MKEELGAKNCKEQEARREIVEGARSMDAPKRGSLMGLILDGHGHSFSFDYIFFYFGSSQ